MRLEVTMPLVLSLRKDQDFFVGEERFIVTDVMGETHFKLRHEGTGRVFEITDRRSTEILAEVFVSAGDRPKTYMARVAVEAPAAIKVLRGDRKRNPSEGVRH
jgi:hypothetical protein